MSGPEPSALNTRRLVPPAVSEVEVVIRWKFAGRHTQADAIAAAEERLLGAFGGLIVRSNAWRLMGPGPDRTAAEFAATADAVSAVADALVLGDGEYVLVHFDDHTVCDQTEVTPVGDPRTPVAWACHHGRVVSPQLPEGNPR